LARKGKDFVSKKNKENWLSVRRPKKKGLITFAQKGEAFISKKKMAKCQTTKNKGLTFTRKGEGFVS
jgi:hypothetical protein